MSVFRLSASPALRLAMLVIAGILASQWLAMPAHLLIPAFLTAVLIALVCFSLSRRSAALAAFVTPSVILVCVLAGATKLAVDRDRSMFTPDSLLGREVVLIGNVSEPPHTSGKTTRFILHAGEIRVATGMVRVEENVRVSIAGNRADSVQPMIHYGSVLALRGRLSRPSDARNPGEFSEKQYYEANGITMFMRVRGAASVLVVDSTEGSWLMSRVVVPTRDYILHVIDRTTEGEGKEFLKGLLIGERSGISVSTRQAFTNSGVAHVLAVSGSNVVVVAAIVILLFGSLRFPRWARILLTIAVLFFYMLITASQPPVVRATIVAAIFLLGGLIQVKSNPYNSLGVAAVIILGIDARQLFDVGFQLSFMAVLSIVYLYPKMNLWIALLDSSNPLKRALMWTLRVCAVSLAASLGTLPLTAVYFGKVSVIGLLTNIPVIPSVGASVVLGFITITTHLVSQWIAQTYAEFNQLLLDVTLWVIRVTGNVSFASVDTSRFAPVYAFPFYMALLLFFNLNVRHATRRLLIILLLSLNLAVVVPPPSAVARNDGRLRVTFLDVGQGDASVVELPDGRVLVIDAGPRADRYDAGERTVGSFLRRRGVSRIDVLVVSHPHDDHLGGVPYLLEHFDVGRVVESGQPINSFLFRAYSAELQEEQCGIDTARRGDIVDSFRDVRLYVIAPVVSCIDADTSLPHSNMNNTSVVLKMQYGRVSFLFSGDAEVDVEEEMVERYGAFLQSNVLKVGHHGSRTSSTQEFLDAVRPTCAVISVGRFNKFRHPSEEVLARLRAMQTDVYRTDEDGAVIFESDGKTLSRVDWR